MLVELKYDLGQIVFIKTDKEQSPRMVIGANVRPSGILYELGCGNVSSWHYEMEVTEDKNVLVATTN